MSLVRPNIEKMKGYVPGEQPCESGFIKLNTNENPYPPPPGVRDAVLAEAERARLYPDPLAGVLRERIAALNGLAVENVIVGNGSDDALTMVTRAFAGEGDLVASPSPTYTLYTTLCEIQGARYVVVPYDENYSFDASGIPADARIVFVCNPNSPSGTVVPEDLLAEVASRVSGVLVVDEAYVDFADRNCGGLQKKFENVILLRSFSKSFSLAGLRIGYALASREIIENLLKVKDSYNVNRLAIAAACAALDDIDRVKRNIEKIKATRARLSAELEKMGFYVYPSQANFVLARSGGFPAEEIYRGLRDKKILVRYYDTPRLRDCLRISVGTDEEIDALLSAIKLIIGA